MFMYWRILSHHAMFIYGVLFSHTKTFIEDKVRKITKS